MNDLIPESEQQYGSILTIAGENAEQNSKVLKLGVEITHIAFGDANDTYVQPNRNSQALVNEIHRIKVNSVDVQQATPDSVPMLKVEAILPPELSDLVIREFATVATFNGQTFFHAIGNCARIYVPKPVNNGNVPNPVTLEMLYVITSGEAIVEIDPRVVHASREWVGHRLHILEKQTQIGEVFPLDWLLTAKEQDEIVNPAKYLRDAINDALYEIHPEPAVGIISKLSFADGTATIGGKACLLIKSVTEKPYVMLDSFANFQYALNTGLDVILLPNRRYDFRDRAFEMNHDGQCIYLNGSELIIKQVYGRGENCQIILDGGTLSQGMRTAVVAVDTVAGSDTIIVEDGSNLVVGQKLSSSWGVEAQGEFPLRGVDGIKIKSISGNTVTLESSMQGMVVTLPKGLVIGDFDNSAFLASDRGLKVSGGVIKDVHGYYYHTPSAAKLGGWIDFADIIFDGNGRDQFYMKKHQKLRFTRCRSRVPYDVAKTGVVLDDNASLYLTDCPDMGLGNYDSNVSIWGNHTTSEIVVSGATNIHGKTYLDPAIGGFASNVYNAIMFNYEGTINKISLGSGVAWRHVKRWLLTTTTTFKKKQQRVVSLKLNPDNIETSLYSFNHDGAGNGITIDSFIIEGVKALKSRNYIMGGVAEINGAISHVQPIITGSVFEMNNGGDQKTNSIQSGEIYNSTFKNGDPINVTKNLPYLDKVKLVNQAIQINPTYSGEFVGGGGMLLIDNPDFPLNISNIFLMPGAAAGFANFYSVKSVRGDLVYDVYNFEGSAALSATVYIGNGKYQLQGDDWYIPTGSRIVDLAKGTTQRVAFALPTTLPESAESGAASVTVTSTGPNSSYRAKVGDKINIALDSGLVHTTTIASSYAEPSVTIPLETPLPESAASGKNVMIFRVN